MSCEILHLKGKKAIVTSPNSSANSDVGEDRSNAAFRLAILRSHVVSCALPEQSRESCKNDTIVMPSNYQY